MGHFPSQETALYGVFDQYFAQGYPIRFLMAGCLFDPLSTREIRQDALQFPIPECEALPSHCSPYPEVCYAGAGDRWCRLHWQPHR